MAITVPHSKLALESYLDWAELPVVVQDNEPDNLIYLQAIAEGKPVGGARIIRSAGPIRIPRSLFPPFASLVGAKSDESKAYVSLNVDLNNDVEVQLVAVDETGASGGGGGEGSARIAGTVKIDGEAVARDVVVISDDPSGRQVVGEGESASDGTFDITYSDWTGPVIALALDNYGQAWAAGANLNNGTVVHPTTPNGYVYQVTSAGTTGTEEPTWSTEGSVIDGSVTYEAKPYYRPVASGPLSSEVIAGRKVELQSALDSASELVEEEYSEESWSILVAAVESGEAVMLDPDATQAEIDDATAALWSAMNQLVSGDPHWGDVTLLLHADGSTTEEALTDYSLVGQSVTNLQGVTVSGEGLGRFNRSLVFDGDWSRAEVGTSPVVAGEKFTIEAWVMVTGDNPLNDGQAFWAQSNNRAFGEQYLGVSNTGYIRFDRRPSHGDTILQESSGPAIQDNTYHHVAHCYDGEKHSVYVDGIRRLQFFDPVGWVDQADNGFTLGGMVIGSFSGARTPLSGMMDEIRITRGVVRYTSDFTPPDEPYLDFGPL